MFEKNVQCTTALLCVKYKLSTHLSHQLSPTFSAYLNYTMRKNLPKTFDQLINVLKFNKYLVNVPKFTKYLVNSYHQKGVKHHVLTD